VRYRFPTVAQTPPDQAGATVPPPTRRRSRAADILQELGSVDALPVVRDAPQRPLWRGRLHQLGAVVSVPMLIILAASTTSAHALVAVLIYAVGLSATFAVSALYHRTPNAPPRWRSRLQRADHATIYLAIGGTCTPVCLIGLPSAWGVPLLATVAAGVAGGITCSLIRRRWAEITSGVLYIAVGWSTVVVLPPLIRYTGWAPALLIAIGGVLYTVGAILFSRGVPRLSLRVFGYHEVWHTFTLVAAGCHFAAIWLLVHR
jgi:hemolysin III